MYDARVDFWEKWREFLVGGMKNRFLSKNGKHPPPPEGREAGHPAGQMVLRADGPPECQGVRKTEDGRRKTEGRT